MLSEKGIDVVSLLIAKLPLNLVEASRLVDTERKPVLNLEVVAPPSSADLLLRIPYQVDVPALRGLLVRQHAEVALVLRIDQDHDQGLVWRIHGAVLQEVGQVSGALSLVSSPLYQARASAAGG